MRIVHVSDLHIADTTDGEGEEGYLQVVHGPLSRLVSPPSLDGDWEILRRSVGQAARRADWVLITGDLAHSGGYRDLRLANEVLVGLEREIVEKSGKKMIVMPGNHDRYEAPGIPYPGNSRFDRTMYDYWRAGQGVEFEVLSEVPPIQAGVADFSLRAQKGSPAAPIQIRQLLKNPRRNAAQIERLCKLAGQGRVYSNALRLLREGSRRLVRQGWRIVWIVHFAPFPRKVGRGLSRKRKEFLRLLNEEALIEAARELGVRHIFCGHTHEVDRYQEKGVEVFCSGMSVRTSRRENGWFRVIELDERRGRLETIGVENYAVWGRRRQYERV